MPNCDRKFSNFAAQEIFLVAFNFEGMHAVEFEPSDGLLRQSEAVEKFRNIRRGKVALVFDSRFTSSVMV